MSAGTASRAGGESHYEALGLKPGATPEQVERAYRFAVEMYRDGALATYSLLEPAETQAARARVEEAYAVLRDPERRRAYDASRGFATPELLPQRSIPSARPQPVPSAPPTPPPAGPPLVLAEPVTGAVLKRVREERGVSLQEIASRSKVGVRYLEYIEQERHALLPAAVYLRGFLLEYARAVGLEPRATADAYLARLGRG